MRTKYASLTQLAKVEQMTGKKARGGGEISPWGARKNDDGGEDVEEEIEDEF